MLSRLPGWSIASTACWQRPLSWRSGPARAPRGPASGLLRRSRLWRIAIAQTSCPFDIAYPVYRRIAASLASGVDLFVCETMASAAEARAAALAGVETGLPVWVSWSLHDDTSGRLRSGESVAEAIAAVRDLPIDAFLFNCSTPESIGAALPALRRLTDRSIGAYANAFRPVPGDWDMARDGLLALRDDISPAVYAAIVEQWERCGATIFGGCCGIGPDHIACLARRV
jgi:S-methylmethionine-dependent homocysteine/selenocysteine methylase